MQIRDLFKSIVIETELLKNSYNVNGIIESSNVESFIELLSQYLKKGIIKEASKVQINGDSPYTLHSLDDISTTLKNNNSSNLELSLFKNDSDNLIVFSFEAFCKTIKNNLSNNETIIDTLNLLFTKKVILIESENFEVLSYIVENEIFSEYLNEFSKSIRFNSPSKLKVSPYNVDIEKIEIQSDTHLAVKRFLVLINTLKNFLSLLYILSSINIKDEKLEVLFDGTRERYFKLTSDEIIDNFSTLNMYKELFFWIYKKESTKKNLNFIEKLDITRNLIATTISSEKGLLEINDNVYDILKKSKSNYKIYLKSKTKDYFELRFKIEEHTDKLFNSLGDEFSKFADFFRSNLYIFVGILFSSVVLTILRTQVKNANDTTINIFLNPTFSTAIFLYGILSLLIMVITLLKTSFNICDLDNQLKAIKRKYINFIDKKDLLNIIGNTYSKRRTKNIILIVVVSVIWVSISLGLIFNKKILSIIELNNKVEKSIALNQESNEIIKPKDNNEDKDLTTNSNNDSESKKFKKSIITEKTILKVKAQIKEQKENHN